MRIATQLVLALGALLVGVMGAYGLYTQNHRETLLGDAHLRDTETMAGLVAQVVSDAARDGRSEDVGPLLERASTLERDIAAGRRRVAAVTLILTLAAAVIVPILRRTLSRPLDRMLEAVERLGDPHPDGPVRVPAFPGELGRLARAFNDLDRRLEEKKQWIVREVEERVEPRPSSPAKKPGPPPAATPTRSWPRSTGSPPWWARRSASGASSWWRTTIPSARPSRRCWRPGGSRSWRAREPRRPWSSSRRSLWMSW